MRQRKLHDERGAATGARYRAHLAAVRVDGDDVWVELPPPDEMAAPAPTCTEEALAAGL